MGSQLLMLNASLDRRAFLRHGSLILAGTGIASVTDPLWAADNAAEPVLRVGLLTDCHYADRDAAGTRHYRESLGKVAEAVAHFNDVGADVAVELGDIIDAAPDVDTELGFLKSIEAEYARFHGDRHYVLGNHCVYTLTKDEFVAGTAMPSPYYSFDSGPLHFVVLDACSREDGTGYGRKNFDWTDTNIAPDQVAWLEDDLAANERPALVFVHQRLDLDRDVGIGKHYAIKNGPTVRGILEQSGHVLAVFQGHSHENDYRQRGGIHYCTCRAVVEGSGEASSGYAVANVYADGSIRLSGHRQQANYAWPAT